MLKKTKNIPFLLLKLWIWSLGLAYLVQLPEVGRKVQLSEGIFFLLALTSFAILFRLRILWKPFLPFLVLFSLMGIVVLINLEPTVFLEWMGLGYLILTSWVVLVLLFFEPKLLTVIKRSFLELGIALSVLGMLVWIGHLIYPSFFSGLVDVKQLPGSGIIRQVELWMPSANMLANLLVLCFLIGRNTTANKKHRLLFFVLLSGGLLSTFSKSLVFLLPVIILVFLERWTSNWKWLLFPVIFFFLLLTHYLPIKIDGQITTTELVETEGLTFLTDEQVFELGPWPFYKTSYTVLKEQSWKAFWSSPVTGVGPGNFNSFLESAKESNDYPLEAPLYDPHSTYWGVLAEMGLIGIGFLLVFITTIFTFWKWSSLLELPQLVKGLGIFLLILVVEAINMDVINFRHFWIAIGVLAYYALKEKVILGQQTTL